MKLHHLAFRSKNYIETTAFYQNVLNLKLVYEQMDYSKWLRSGDLIIMIEKACKEESVDFKDNHQLVCFEVDKERKEVILRNLKRYGIELEEKTEKTYYFRDPDCRKIAISDFNFDEYIKSQTTNNQ